MSIRLVLHHAQLSAQDSFSGVIAAGSLCRRIKESYYYYGYLSERSGVDGRNETELFVLWEI